LDWMTHRGPFQPLLFCDSVILWFWDLGSKPLLRPRADTQSARQPGHLPAARRAWIGHRRASPNPPGAGRGLPPRGCSAPTPRTIVF